MTRPDATVRRVHTWVMSLLYIGTFGSFIGYSAAFPLVLKTQFPDLSNKIAFTGALVGSLARPLGGWLADRIGGARVTAAVFVALGLGALAVIRAVDAHTFAGFLTAFLALFAAGAGNGSTYRMIPAIFRAKAAAAAAADPDAAPAILLRARREGAAALGVAGAIGALGGFYLPRAISNSMTATGGIAAAFVAFIAVYALCLGVTWWYNLRRRVLATRVPSLAHATV